MRIHSDEIASWETVSDALTAQKKLGRIAPHVTFKLLLPAHRSTVRRYAYEVQLQAAIADNGRRSGNSGSYGAMSAEIDGYAATFDEWGWLLGALYEIDPEMVTGDATHPIYADRAAFDQKTGLTYHPQGDDGLLHQLLHEDSDPYPIVVGQGARAKRGYIVGRYGANRYAVEGFRAYWPHKESPRDAFEYARFAGLDVDSSASRQHYIDTGDYLAIGEAITSTEGVSA